jgi:dephospho-CoA kinase
MARVVALCGRYHSGKDTVAKMLCEDARYRHVKISSGLKDACGALFGLTQDQLEGPDKDVVDPRWKVTPRKILQFVGTEMMQFKLQELLPEVGRNFWIDAAIRSMDDPKTRFVISDLRFVHEYDALRKAFADRLAVVCIERPGEAADDSHVSEQEFRGIPADHVLQNTGTVDQLLTQARDAIR